MFDEGYPEGVEQREQLQYFGLGSELHSGAPGVFAWYI
jgi:hypothetical protein